MPQVDINASAGMRIDNQGFGFSAVHADKLSSTEYTLATIAVDLSGSTSGFNPLLRTMLKEIVKALRKDPRAFNMLIRVIAFNTTLTEIHGFMEPDQIDDAVYDNLVSSGSTALFDATYAALEATERMAESLVANHIDCNAGLYIITDGDDNASSKRIEHIKTQLEAIMLSEKIESIITFLIGLKDPSVTNAQHASDVDAYLTKFKDKAGIMHYMNHGDVSAASIAKLAFNISQSVSSQSQSQGTGGPSQFVF